MNTHENVVSTDQNDEKAPAEQQSELGETDLEKVAGGVARPRRSSDPQEGGEIV